MPSTIVTLNDGLQVEVDINEDQYQEIADEFKNKVDSSVDQIQHFLKKIIKPVSNSFEQLNDNVSIEQAKVNIGIKFGIEGNLILAKSNTSANFQLEMIIRPTNNG